MKKDEKIDNKADDGACAESPAEEAKEAEPEDLKKKLEEAEDRILRLGAEFENSKKRIQKQSDESAKYAIGKLVLEILEVVDDLDRAISSLDQGHDLKIILQGMHLVQSRFHRILDQNGVRMIETAGQPFDPEFHEAVGEVATDQVPEGHVVDEIQRGYTLNDRLARAAKVRVAKGKNIL